MQVTKEVTVLSNKQIADQWSNISSAYSNIDSCPQSTYFALVNLLKIPEAKDILEVACGNGKLLPYALNLKPEDCNYYAIDIAANMISNAQAFLQHYINKIGVNISLKQWLKQQRLHLFTQNGEQPFKIDVKFDRIILNVVLQITENPLKMLKNLHNYAVQGCIMGISIPGNQQQSDFFLITKRLMEELKLPTSGRSYYYLYNRFEPIANEAGWEVVTSWEQNAVFPYFELDQKFIDFNTQFLQLEGKHSERLAEKVSEVFKQKKMISYPFQLFVLRKK